jgi:putative oxidoreductase
MKKHQDTATFLLRIALAIGFLSAVFSRLGLWGEYSSGWQNFVAYAEKVNSFAPKNSIPVIAILSTILETVFALMLLPGYKTRLAATGAAILTVLFAIAMTYSFGIKDPLDYSVFVFSAAAFLLATMPQYRWSIDQILLKNKN